jgi:hypothetical protein
MNDFNGITNDLLASIFEYSSPIDILRLSETSKRSHRLIIRLDRTLYKNFFNLVIATKEFNTPTQSLLERISNLDSKLIQKYLNGIDTSECMNDMDFYKTLMVKILFAYPTNKYPSKECHWMISLPVWKASYYHIKKDIQRQKIMKQELMNIPWELEFKSMPSGAGYEEGLFARFQTDNHIHISSFQITYPWRLMHNHNIKVAEYPPLIPKRLPNGAWKLENVYVTYTQSGPMDCPLPLIDNELYL